MNQSTESLSRAGCEQAALQPGAEHLAVTALANNRSPQERRNKPRAKLNWLLYANLSSRNGGIVLDISETGSGLYAATPFEEGGIVTLSFVGSMIAKEQVTAEISWTDQTKKKCGLRFTNLSGEALRQVQKWIGTPELDSAKRAGHATAIIPRERRVLDMQAALRGCVVEPKKSEPSRHEAKSAEKQIVEQKNEARRAESKPSEPKRPAEGQTAIQAVQTIRMMDAKELFDKPVVNGAEKLLPTWTVTLDAKPVVVKAASVGQSGGTVLKVAAAPQAAPRKETAREVKNTATMRRVSKVAVAFLLAGALTGLVARDKVLIGRALIRVGEKLVGEGGAERVRGWETKTPSQTNTPPIATNTSVAQPIVSESATLGEVPAQQDPKSADGGEADVKLAQRYLSGDGSPESQAAAAKLLQRAVREGNTAAELPLADLYSRGAGIAKDCKQARSLLDDVKRKNDPFLNGEASAEIQMLTCE